MIPGSATPLLLAKSGDDGYKIDRSLRFNSGDSAYLSRTPSSAGSRKTWTWTGWIKKSSVTGNTTFFSAGSDGSTRSHFMFDGTTHTLRFFDLPTSVSVITTQVFRDQSAWYHIVLAADTTQSTASNRIKIYVNGVQVTSFSSSNYPSQNAELQVNRNAEHALGRGNTYHEYFDGYLAEVHFIDGQQLAATDFGETDNNNVWQPKTYSGSYGTNGFHLDFSDNSSNAALGTDSSGNSNTWTVNNLQAVAGLSTANQGFNVVTYTGNGGTQSIPVGFAPDFVWIKERNGTKHHALCDSVRGNGKLLYSSSYSGEQDIGSSVVALTSTGFDLGYNSGFSAVSHNYNSINHVAWCWKAGGTASSNSDGSITSSVSANNTYGFSIVTYTGTGSNATIGHGLNAAPGLVIVKKRSAAGSWSVWHKAFGTASNTDYIYLDSANQQAQTGSDAQPFWNNTVPSSNVVSLGTGGNVNGSSDTFVAYCWSEIPGFSKFGSFTHASTTSLDLGFKPKFFLIKEIDGTTPWYLFDAERDSFDDPLFPNTNGSEGNGFAFTANNTGISWVSGSLNAGTYIYAAFADKPPGEIIDSLIDSPTNYTADSGNNGGNYCTLNPLDKHSDFTTSNGNLDAVTSGSSWRSIRGTIGISSGKYYWEFTTGHNRVTLGISTSQQAVLDGYVGDTSQGWSYFYSGDKYNASSNVSYGASYAAGDTIGVAFDADAGNIYFYKNGSVQNSGTAAYTGLTSGPYFPTFSFRDSGSTHSANFGQRPFKYTPPSGYKSLCTTNLPDPTIADGSTGFDTKLWQGTGVAKSITGYNFSPDLVWGKARSATNTHWLMDTVRGAGKRLVSADTRAEDTPSGVLTSFNSDGFSIGTNTESNNSDGTTYVGWAWDAGSSNTSISAGGLNSSAYDQSQTWSSNTYFNNNGNGYNGSNTITKLFDGVAGSVGADGVLPAGSGDFTLNFGTTFSSASTVTFDLEGGGNSLKVNGSFVTLPGGSRTTVTYNVSGLSTIQWYHGAGSTYCFLLSIKVDGKELVDNGVSITNNVPSLAATVRANPSAGFSIVTYTGNGTAGTTIGHNLNVAPELIIVKCRSNNENWRVYTKTTGNTKSLFISTNEAPNSSSNYWNSTSPTSSVFSVGNDSGSNNNGYTYVAYCFAPVAGYSAFGSYTGNGSTDGPFVFTGFRPALIAIKRTDSSGAWKVLDTTRSPFNVASEGLDWNASGAEFDNSENDVDILSNGFKLKTSHGARNASSGTFIYMAWAEHPFKTARAR